MASARFSKGSEEWMMFVDFWSLCQKHWVPENDELYWDTVNDDAREFCKKFESIELATPLMIAFVNCLDKQITGN